MCRTFARLLLSPVLSLLFAGAGCCLAILAITTGLPSTSTSVLANDIPSSMSALGDSITRAANSSAFGDQPANSWSTGTNIDVQSVYLRILAENPAISGSNFNDAVSGARMIGLKSQAETAVGRGVDLVTILMGANDVCTTSEGTMTPVSTFQSQFEEAMDVLSTGLPDARIAVVSIPDIHILWEILKDDSTARNSWSSFNICQSLLANPLSEDPEDIQRRLNVRQRNIDFNNVLEQVCAQYAQCSFDDRALFNFAFEPVHVSTLDYFHPSVAGLTAGAEVTWDALFVADFQPTPTPSPTLTPAPTPTATPTPSPTPTPTATLEPTPAPDPCDPPPPWPVPPGDSDCDGWTDQEEEWIGTDPFSACGLNAGAPGPNPAWPPDLHYDNLINILDINELLPPVFGQSYPFPDHTHPWAWLDVHPDGTINILDINRLLPPLFGASCSP